MATRHTQQLANYLSRHKNVTASPSRDSDSASSLSTSGQKSHSQTNISRRSNNRHNYISPLNPGRSKLPCSQTVRTTQLTGRTANLDGYLPDELILYIFSYLDIVGLLTVSQVSRRWYALSKDDSLWKPITELYTRANKVEKEKTTNCSSAGCCPSFHTQWKAVCIARCAKWRNQRALKLVKKAWPNPFTGLPRDTEKALKESGVTYQLSLVDTYGKECYTESSSVTLHKSATGVVWHSLHFPPLSIVRHLRILAICPLFYNDGGRVVKGSPYQRSLLWEADVRLSEWVTAKHILASDDLLTLYKLPSDILLATWNADQDIAFFAAGLHYHQLVQKCMLGKPTESYIPQAHKVIPDDIDNSYGLHDYKATVELRTLRQTLWSQQFSGLHCRRHDLALGAASFILIRHDNIVDHTPLEKPLCLPWRTELFKGSVEHAAWLDVTVLDERGEIFFAASSPVKAERPTVRGSDMEYEESQHLLIKYEGDRASVHLHIGKLDHGKAFVRHLELLIKASAINEWFGTKYLIP